jgi:hypothetical protein
MDLKLLAFPIGEEGGILLGEMISTCLHNAYSSEGGGGQHPVTVTVKILKQSYMRYISCCIFFVLIYHCNHSFMVEDLGKTQP